MVRGLDAIVHERFVIWRPLYPACLCHDRLKEELCGIIRRMLTPAEITKENIDVEAIKTVGIGGSYLMQPETLKHCRTEFFLNDLFKKLDPNTWPREGSKRVEVCAADPRLKRLSAYEKPDIDPAVEADLARFVTRRRNKDKSYYAFRQRPCGLTCQGRMEEQKWEW